MKNSCKICNKPIDVNDSQVIALSSSTQIHSHCFKCVKCSKVLDSYVDYENLYYCEPCYRSLRLVKCDQCNAVLSNLNNHHIEVKNDERIEGEIVEMIDQKYYEINGQRLCAKCFAKMGKQ
ncbi:hypothetical protein RDWZM_001955 [Blomia tropicalis]|uniref:LIM zinc-binding domain-containing protein n=1 Tax=Blomia tropicalis TaxID=40697 RepID=A0A9Q0MCK3_BLOTA|nr:hypothetical protein RDWZM_001955 [Blomia tropicalis]